MDSREPPFELFVLPPAMPSRLLFFFPLALAVVLLPNSCEQKPKPPAGSSPTGAAAAMEHTRAIVAVSPRPPGSPGLARTRRYLVEQLQASGWQVAEDRVTGQGPNGPVTFVNLIARHGDSVDAAFWNRPVRGLLGAHIDSKFYPGRNFVGALDAAASVGLILELARQLQDQPEKARQLELVFFDGEEAFGENIGMTRIGGRQLYDGLYGSRHYAGRWRAARQKPEFGLILDLLGHPDLQVRYPADSPQPLVDVMMRAASGAGVEERFQRASGPILDDHVPLNNAGIPTLDIIGDFREGDWWHTDRDNLSLVSEESLATFLQIVRTMLDELLAPPSGE